MKDMAMSKSNKLCIINMISANCQQACWFFLSVTCNKSSVKWITVVIICLLFALINDSINKMYQKNGAASQSSVTYRLKRRLEYQNSLQLIFFRPTNGWIEWSRQVRWLFACRSYKASLSRIRQAGYEPGCVFSCALTSCVWFIFSVSPRQVRFMAGV